MRCTTWSRTSGRGAKFVLLLVVFTSAACSSLVTDRAPGVPEPARSPVVISAGDPTGVYYAWSQQLARQLKVTNPRLTIVVQPSDGSVANLQALRDGTADLALTTVDATQTLPPTPVSPVAADAIGERAANAVPLQALGRIYDDYVQIVVRASSSLYSVDDLAGRRVAVNTPGSGTALVAGRVLDAAGISVIESEYGVADGTQALLDHTVDAVFWSGGIPTPSITAAAARTPLRLLPLGDLPSQLRATYGSVYRPATIPPGRYPGADQVTTMASANLLVARADADPDMVTAVLSTIFDQRDAIGNAVPAADATDRRTAIWTGSLPLHPAAMEYYRGSKP